MLRFHSLQYCAIVTARRDRQTTRVRQLLLGLLAVVSLTASAAAGPFSQLVIFGDSLSDVGNIAQATGGIYPGQYYWNNRFSNGPVYAEALASGLGVPMVRSTAGGDNFAYGGAKTSGTGGLEGFFIRDLDEQVDQYLATRTTDANALFVVFAGSNDLVGGQTNVSIPVTNLAEDIGRLIADGARNFLVPNLPLLGYTPRYNGSPATLATYNTRTEQFNAALSTMLDGLEANNPAVALHRFDTAGLFNQALTNPAAFGFTNVTQSAAPGLQPGASSYNTNQIAPNPNEYVFWDDLHPTTAVHAILAEHMLQLFALAGDFNQDDTVDAADYIDWRKASGAASDYDTWRAHFGQSAQGSASHSIGHSAAVPEPQPWSAILVATTLILARLRRREAGRANR
jgi:phospholipase/lecithinase/hemolysin